MITGFFAESIVKRAQEKRLLDLSLIDLRKYAIDKYGTVDDKPYGGGVGMVMRVDVIHKALESVILGSKATPESDSGQARMTNRKNILTSPKGKAFNQQKAQELSKLDHLVIIAGHYEGVDERVNDFVDEEISLGDFVMTGGELTAAAIVDSVVRLIPGVLKKEEATLKESFFENSVKYLTEFLGDHPILKELRRKGVKTVKLLEYPQYTRSEDFKGKKVPDVLLSGNHKEIEKWRLKKAFEETLKKRPDLLRG